jgi:multidrug efflux system outer membrane protein
MRNALLASVAGRKLFRSFAALPPSLAVALLAACAVGPDYQAPVTEAAPFVAAPAAAVSEQPFEAAWWKQFQDPVLDSLIERALKDDLDLKIALARVEESRAFLGASRRNRWPGVVAAVSRTESNQQQPLFSTDRIDSESYSAGLATLWELDLFGRVRRGVEAARADDDATVADLRDAQVLIAAEVARNYVELRGAQKRLAVARENLGYSKETLDLTRVRLELGRGTELDVASAAARFSATEATIPPLVEAEQVAANRLAVLLGERPGALAAELAPREITPHLTTIAVDSPAALLQRRPDIRAAERELAAATARIGVAKADLFPRLTLSGFIGFVAGDAGQLGESSSRAWSLSPALSWAGFERGTYANVAVAEARTHAALAAYELTVLHALEETENAFVSYGTQRSRLESVVDQATASRTAAELARIQYREGALDFLRLLDAERTLLQAEDAVAAAESDLNASVVLIYKALGGGWEAAPVPTT